MGEIADMMLDGILDCETGEYLGDAVGYPRSARSMRSINHDGPGRKRRTPHSSPYVMRAKDRAWLHRIAAGNSGMYPGQSQRHIPTGPARRLQRAGLIEHYGPHNSAHDDRWIATLCGLQALECNGAQP